MENQYGQPSATSGWSMSWDTEATLRFHDITDLLRGTSLHQALLIVLSASDYLVLKLVDSGGFKWGQGASVSHFLPHAVKNFSTWPPSLKFMRHQTAAKRSNFWQSDLRDNCDYVFQLTSVMPVPVKTLHFSNKQNSQTVQTANKKIISINLTHWTMKSPQNVPRMSTVSPDTSRETTTPLTDGCNNNRMVQLSPFHKQSLFQFCKTSLK